MAAVLMASLWFAAFAAANSGRPPQAPAPQQIHALNEQTVGKLAAQDAVHRQWLASPEARHQRVASRTSYVGLSDSGALSLASQLFPGVAAKAWRGLALPAGQKLVGYAGPRAAVVDDAHGHRSVVQSQVPLVGRTPDGSQAPADLGLRDVGAAFAPASASVGVRLPKTADGTMNFPDLGIGVRVAATRAVDASLRNDHLGYARALADTDMFWQATPLGAEQSFQLRSPASPRDIMLKFDLAPGDTLRVAGKDDLMSSPMGSAEIDRNGKRVLSMVASSAVDAQGAPVAVSYSVSSSDPNSLRLHVADGGDVAWPVMLDPSFVEGTWGVNGANPTTTSPEHWYSSAPYSDFAAFYQNQNLEVGGNAAYGPYYNNDYGLWAVATPGPTQHNGVFMYRLQNQGVQHGDYPSPYGSPAYTYYQLEIINNALTTPLTGGGYKNGSGPTYLFGGHYAEYAEGGSDGGSTFDVCANTPSYLNGAGSSPNACTPAQYDGPVGAPPVGYFELVVWNGTGYQWPNAPQLYVPNEATWLSDDVTPSLSAPAPSNSSGWYQSYSGSTNVSGNDTGPDSSLSGGSNSDSGLGIQSITLTSQQGGVTDTNGGSTGLTVKPSPACDSTNSTMAYGSCIGNSGSGTINYKTINSGSGAIPEGNNTVTVTATSVSGQTTTQSWPLKIDRTPPTIVQPTGPLWDDRASTDPNGNPLDKADETLSVQASDPYSGVQTVQLLVDGAQIDSSHTVSNTCTTGGCPGSLSASFDFQPDVLIGEGELSPGQHTISIVATDQAGNTSPATSWQVYVPDPTNEVDDTDQGDSSSDSYSDVPDNETCPSNSSYSDPNYCSPDASNVNTQHVSLEPPVQSGLATLPIAGDAAYALTPPSAQVTDPTQSADANVRTLASSCDNRVNIAGPPPSGSGTRWGLSDQNGFAGEDTFANSNAQALNLMHVRLIVPWDLIIRGPDDSHRCADERNVYDFISRAQARGMDILVSFEHSRTQAYRTTEPSDSDYTAAVQSFLTRFPYVKLYLPWNEPNYHTQPTAHDPTQAGKYYDDLNNLCRSNGRGCVVGAGDFSDVKYRNSGSNINDQGLTNPYLSAYYQGMGQVLPAFWAVHVYQTISLISSDPNETRLLHFLQWGPVMRTHIVWVTEGGSYLYRQSGKTYDQQTQANRLDNFFKSSTFDQSQNQTQTEQNAFVTRVYYYEWHAADRPHTDDTGLVAGDGKTPRTIYCTYKSRTASNGAGC